jgi:GNAT superfamily N-acetyltransferase
MIVSWLELKKTRSAQKISQLKNLVYDICLISAEKKDFESEEEKDAFCWRWVGQYLELFPELSFLSLDISGESSQEGLKVLGYIAGCPDTSQFLDKLDQKAMFWWLESYPEGFKKFPAHFHINCHPEARGKGTGSVLMKAFLEACVGQGISGVHLITVKGARNVGFYERQGFQLRGEHKLEGNQQTVLVFLGKFLSNS